MITWEENNGNYVARKYGKYVGLVSQNPVGTMNEGLWNVALHTKDEGLISLGPFTGKDSACCAFESAESLDLTYDEWLYVIPNNY